MKMEEKRIFISDLPETASKDEIEAKFQKYGTVKCIEIKERKDLGAKNTSLFFSYVNIEIDDHSLQKCFKDFGNNKWLGSYVQLQIARESFLDRLKREREQNGETVSAKPANCFNGNANKLNEPTENKEPFKPDKKIEKISPIKESSKAKETIVKKHVETSEESSSSSESESEDEPIKIKIVNNKGKSLENALKIESFGKPIIEINKYKKVPLEPKSQSDLKRIESLNRMKNNYQAQKFAIQSSLTKIDLKPSLKPKKPANEAPKTRLFDDEGDDEMHTDFQLREQFEGKQGHKLFQLQSRYRNDSRFKLDSRFLEDDQNGDYNMQEMDINEEKKKQYEILEQVLGRKVNDTRRERKAMLRFDPSQPEHSKYELKNEQSSKKTKKRRREDVEEPEKPPEVSKEVFYKVTDNLKETFQESQGFSMLSKFGRVENQEKETNDWNGAKVVQNRNIMSSKSDPFKCDSADEGINEKVHETPKSSGKLWQESFFFKTDDYRLQEGFEFVERMKVSETTEFRQIRRDVKNIVRAKVKNNLRNSNPFKNKLGGNKRRKIVRIKKALKR